MANLNFQYSSAPLRSIQEIQFGLFSPEEIKNFSVAHIEYPETMVSLSLSITINLTPAHEILTVTQDEQKQRPRERGLNDPRLGSIDRQFKCGTCEEGMAECPGHFGHIELATPVFHVGMLLVLHSLP